MSAVRTSCMLILLMFSPADTNSAGQDKPNAKPAAPGSLVSVKGEVEKPLELTPEQFAKLPRKSIETKDHDGKDAVSSCSRPRA
jgi:hypothetical protein